MTTPLYDQDSFRGRDDSYGLNVDNGWHAAINTGWNQDVDTLFRPRFVIQEYNGKAVNNILFQIWYRHYTTSWSSWAVVGAATPVTWADTSQYTNGATTTQVLGSGTYGVDESACGVDNALNTGNADFSGNDEIEAEWALTLDSGQVSNGDLIEIQVRRGAGVVLDAYTNTPQITAVAGGVDDLTAVGITTTPVVGTPSVGQEHDLTSVGITADPVVGTPAIGQTHVLSSVGITTTSVLGIPTVGVDSGIPELVSALRTYLRKPRYRQDQQISRPFKLNKNSPQAKRLVGWWPTIGFSGGNVLRDRSEYGNDGALLGLTTGPTWKTTERGLGLFYDNTNEDYISLGLPQVLRITDELSISTWIKVTTNGHIVQRRVGSGYRHYGIYTNLSKIEFFVSQDGTNTFESGPSGLSIVDDKWHHVVGTFTPSVALRVYIDGILEAENTTSIPSSIWDGSSQPVLIGTQIATGGHITGFITDSASVPSITSRRTNPTRSCPHIST
jgi:hypothetical protein